MPGKSMIGRNSSQTVIRLKLTATVISDGEPASQKTGGGLVDNKAWPQTEVTTEEEPQRNEGTLSF
jgi:hypothetical protein